MTDFKVGDKVEMLCDYGVGARQFDRGTVIGPIIPMPVNPETLFTIQLESGHVCEAFAHRFKLVVPEKPQKGDRVKVTYEADYDTLGCFHSHPNIHAVTFDAKFGKTGVPFNATIEIIKRAEPPKPTVKELLDALPDDPDKIAVFLGQQGVLGQARAASSCPIARYLTPLVGKTVLVNAERTAIRNTPKSGVKNPKAVSAFVSAFDRGSYPWLEEKS